MGRVSRIIQVGPECDHVYPYKMEGERDWTQRRRRQCHPGGRDRRLRPETGGHAEQEAAARGRRSWGLRRPPTLHSVLPAAPVVRSHPWPQQVSVGTARSPPHLPVPLPLTPPPELTLSSSSAPTTAPCPVSENG